MFRSNRLERLKVIFDTVRKGNNRYFSTYLSNIQNRQQPLEHADRVNLASMYLVAENAGNKEVMSAIEAVSGMQSYLKEASEKYREAIVQSCSPAMRSKL